MIYLTKFDEKTQGSLELEFTFLSSRCTMACKMAGTRSVVMNAIDAMGTYSDDERARPAAG